MAALKRAQKRKKPSCSCNVIVVVVRGGEDVLVDRRNDVLVTLLKDEGKRIKDKGGKTCSWIVLTVTGPFQSFQWFDQLTMSGISIAFLRRCSGQALRSRRLNRLARNRGTCRF